MINLNRLGLVVGACAVLFALVGCNRPPDPNDPTLKNNASKVAKPSAQGGGGGTGAGKSD